MELDLDPLPIGPVGEEEARRITDYLDIDAPCASADLLFVFGNALQLPARLAAQAMLSGRAGHVVLTGGIHKRQGFNEAEAHQRILLECGVPAAKIIVENASSNTRENVLFSLPIIAARLEIASVRSIMVLATWYHCRRATMALKRYWPQPVRFCNLTYEFGEATRDGWWHSEFGTAQVMRNWLDIPTYLTRDHLVEVQKMGDGYA